MIVFTMQEISDDWAAHSWMVQQRTLKAQLPQSRVLVVLESQ